MGDNVHALPGVKTLTHGEPQADVIDALEGLLADARSGLLVGFAYLAVDARATVATGWHGRADRHDMIAGSSLLQHRILVALDED